MLNPILWRLLSSLVLIFYTPILLALPLPTPRDNHSPIDIQSDNAYFDEKTGDTTYQGNVYATQAGQQLWADSLLIHRTKEGKIDHIHAEGSPAHFISKKDNPKIGVAQDINGHANSIHYYPNDQKIIFLQDAELSQNDRIVQGSHLIYLVPSRTLISEDTGNSKTTVILKPKSGKK